MTTVQIDPVALAVRLTSRFGVSLRGESRPEGGKLPIFVRAADIRPPNGFSVRLAVGWRSVEASFLPDTYAGDLIRAMGYASEPAKNELARLADTFASAGNRISLKINEVPVSDWTFLPASPWHRLELSAVRMTDASETGGEALIREAEEAVGACLALVLSQLPLEEASESPIALFEGGLPEGAKTRVEINRYERSPVNRAACIAFYGARCQVCGLAFVDRYGELGDGYIEVHHRVPVSRMGPGYIVDPRTDLVPLCSNCHSMVHRQDPPLDTNELRARMIPQQTS